MRRASAGYGAAQLGLACTTLVAGAALAAGARAAIASEQLGDGASLALMAGVTATCFVGAALATRFALRHGVKGLRLGTAVLPLGLLAIGACFVRASLQDASVVMEAIVQDGVPAAPAALALGPDGTDIRLSGELDEGVAARLAALLATHPTVKRIHLTSEGGLADEGQALGDIIAAHRLITYVPDYCVSACTLAFVRGRERLILDDARLGFHAPYEEGLFGALYRGNGNDQRAAYLQAGVSPAFVDAALQIDPAGIWYPTDRQLTDARVVTAVIGHDELPDSTLDGSADVQGAREAILRSFPLATAFRRHAPAALDRIAGAWLDGYRHASTEAADLDRLRAALREAVASTLRRADDATLDALARVLARSLSTTDDDEACAALGGEADLLSAAQGDDGAAIGASARAVLDQALVGATAAPIPAAPFARRVERWRSTDCAGWRARYDELLRLPAPAIAARMRAQITASAPQVRGDRG